MGPSMMSVAASITIWVSPYTSLTVPVTCTDSPTAGYWPLPKLVPAATKIASDAFVVFSPDCRKNPFRPPVG